MLPAAAPAQLTSSLLSSLSLSLELCVTLPTSFYSLNTTTSCHKNTDYNYLASEPHTTLRCIHHSTVLELVLSVVPIWVLQKWETRPDSSVLDIVSLKPPISPPRCSSPLVAISWLLTLAVKQPHHLMYFVYPAFHWSLNQDFTFTCIMQSSDWSFEAYPRLYGDLNGPGSRVSSDL